MSMELEFVDAVAEDLPAVAQDDLPLRATRICRTPRPRVFPDRLLIIDPRAIVAMIRPTQHCANRCMTCGALCSPDINEIELLA